MTVGNFNPPEEPAPSDPETPRATEAEVSARVRARLEALRREGRCEFRAEVGLSCWIHGIRNQAERLRIDYVAAFDCGPLVGIEIKRQPPTAADLGRALVQCAQYAGGVVAPALVSRVPAAWVGKPLKAVFLHIDQAGLRDSLSDTRSGGLGILTHARAAARLFGPANVGFAYLTRHNGLRLDLAAGRWFCERYGHRADAMAKAFRVGNGSFRPEGE